MIMVSMRITAVSTQQAQVRQTEAAAVLAGDPGLTGIPGAVTFHVPNTPASVPNVTVTVTVFSTDAFTAFEP
jgi:hypothetical protein